MNTRINYLLHQIELGRSFILDLDNTIYSELDFLKQQYFVVAKSFVPNDIDVAYEFLIDTFQRHGREKIFDKFRSKFSVSETIGSILNVFRDYSSGEVASLEPYQWFIDVVGRQGSEFQFFIITNGNVQQQMEKIRRLDLYRYCESFSVVYADYYSPKPSKESMLILGETKPLRDPIYIGDSKVDEEFSLNCNMEFFSVKEMLTHEYLVC